MDSIFEIALYLLLGALAGTSSGLLGIGGGLIVVPALLVIFYFLGFPPENRMQIAVATSLSAMVITSSSSAWAHLKHVNWLLFKELSPGIILGAILGAFIAYLLPAKNLQSIFGIFLCLFGSYFLFSSKLKEDTERVKPHYFVMGLFGLIIGAISSILGIGGIITVPILIFCGISIRHAISTSAVTGFLIALMGAMSFLFLGWNNRPHHAPDYIYVPAFIAIGFTAALMAPLGAKWAYSTSPVILKRIFGLYQISIGIMMIIF